jgi:hypothetical protein
MKHICRIPAADTPGHIRQMETESHQAGDHRRAEHRSRQDALTAWRTRERRRCGQGGGRNGRRDEHGAIMKIGAVVFGRAVRQNASRERRRCRIEQPRRLEGRAIHGQLKTAVSSLFTLHSAPR